MINPPNKITSASAENKNSNIYPNIYMLRHTLWKANWGSAFWANAYSLRFEIIISRRRALFIVRTVISTL